MRLLLLLLFITVLPSAWGEVAAPNLRFERLSIEQGLSQVNVWPILQDRRGYLWFGTFGGLNRYDGYHFEHFVHDNDDPASISNSLVWASFEDSQGRLWFGTADGLNRYDDSTGRFERFLHDPQNPNSLSHNRIRAIAEDKFGHLWIGTDGGGLNRFDVDKGQFEHFRNDPSNPQSLSHDRIAALQVDKNGVVWIGTLGGGLNRLNVQKRTFERFTSQDVGATRISDNKVLHLAQGDGNILWIATEKGLNRLDSKTDIFTVFRHEPDDPNSLAYDNVGSLMVDNQGRLWVGTFGRGLSLLDNRHGHFIHFRHNSTDINSLSDDVIRAVYQDRQGLMWIGTNAGVNKLDYRQTQFGHIKHLPGKHDSLAGSIVWSVYQDRQGVLWAGTNQGLNRQQNGQGFDLFTHQLDNPGSISNNVVNAITEDSFGGLWVGTNNGLNRYDVDTGLFERFVHNEQDRFSLTDNRIRYIYPGEKGTVWIGTASGGLNRFDPDTKQFTAYKHDPSISNSLSEDDVRAIAKDSQGRLWLGTNNGLNRLDQNSGQIVRYFKKDGDRTGLSSNVLMTLLVDAKGTLWAGTRGGGLNKYNEQSDTFTHWGVKQGLPSNNVICLLDDSQGQLWLGTEGGMVKFDPATESFKIFDMTDGLQSNDFSWGCHKGKDGELFFGGSNGFNRFFADKITEDTEPPTVVLTDFLLSNKSVGVFGPPQAFTLPSRIDTLSTLTLNHEQSFITFEFAALNFVNPKQNQYAYKLEGYNDEWIFTDAKNRRTNYTGLPAGDYTFMVKASNSNGYWNEQGTSLNIRVLPPWWLTWWAKLLYVSIALLAVGGYVIYFQSQYKNQQMQEAEKLKDDFFAKMSHEIRTPMNAVIGLSQLAINTPSETERQNYLRTILESGKSLVGIVNDILDFSKLGARKMKLEHKPFALAQLIELVVAQCALAAHEKGLALTIQVDSKIPQTLTGDSTRLRQVLVNLLNNAVKFTDQGGVSLSIELQKVEAQRLTLYCKVADTGCGLTQQQCHRLFKSYAQADSSVSRVYGGTGLGLVIAKEICELMHGQIWVESEVDKGSVFQFNLELEQGAQDPLPALGDHRILVVEDNNLRADTLINQLKIFGLEATRVIDNEAAKTLLDGGEHFDLALISHDGKERIKPILVKSLYMVNRYNKNEFSWAAGKSHQLSMIERPVMPHQLHHKLSKLLTDGAVEDIQAQQSYTVPELSDYRLLLVDDNAINRKVALGFLTPCGGEVSVAENGLQAVDMLKKEDFDLVLMDIEMPQMNGIEATKIIRESLNLKALPVIAMTSHSQAGFTEQITACGMDGFISKPFEQHEFYQVIGEHLAHSDKEVALGRDENEHNDSEDELQKLEQVKGLEVKTALEKLSGRTLMYLQLVKEFRKVEPLLLDKIKHLDPKCERQPIFMAAHTLRSSAAFIGAFGLAQLSEAVEKRFNENNRKPADDDGELLEQLTNDLKQLLDDLDLALGAIDSDLACKPQPTFSLETFKRQLQALFTMLSRSDFDAEDLLEQIQHQCKGTEYIDEIKGILASVEEVEFDQAAELTQTLMDRL